MGDAARGELVNGGFTRSLTTFVGRQLETRRLADLLGHHRLVTITGPGGVGKTRLAAEVVRAQTERFADGIRLVELAAMHDPAQVPWAVAASLGVQDQTGVAITESTAAVLAGEQSLLVLDNCEHVLAAVAHVCQALLVASDDVQILATSREPIGIAGEAQLRLPPLSTDVATAEPGTADAVTLFLDRVRLREPSFATSPHTTRQAAEIVKRMDGLPLAIELAAARVEGLGMTQLLDRLDAPLGILTTTAHTALPRHRSLWATADWSYQLLDQQGRRVFRRLSVLPGPFTLDTALALAGPGSDSTILTLVDASILAPPRDGPDGRSRYHLLDSLRAYGRDQLESAGELDDATSALAAAALSVADDAAALMELPGSEADAAAWMDAESALLHRALLWGLDHDHATALRLALVLAPWWRLRGLRSMGYPMLYRAADQSTTRPDARWRAAQNWLGLLALGNSAWQLALQHFTTLRDAVQSQPPSIELVDALVGRSAALRNLGRLRAATDDACRGLDVATAIAYAQGSALALTQLVLAASQAGEALTATRRHAQLREIDRTRLADGVARQTVLADALALAEADDLEGARQLCGPALESARGVRDVAGEADLLDLAARIALLFGDVAEAGSYIEQSLRLAARSGHRVRVLDCLHHCAELCAATGRWAEAITLCAAHSAQTVAVATADRPADIQRRDRALAQARHLLGSDKALAAERRGCSMTFHAAAEFAAGLVAAPPPSRPTGRASGNAGLTARERELLSLVAQGHTDAQIAAALFISIRTVRSHLDRIREKSGCRRRADLTRLALQHALI